MLVIAEIHKTIGEYVEPVHLQVVCAALWNNLEVYHPTTTTITRYHVRELGNVDRALAEFYESCVEKASQGDISPARIRQWVEESLITHLGTRGLVYRGNKNIGSLPNSVVQNLVDLHLIRGEWRSGALWYELTHDRLIKPILDVNRKTYRKIFCLIITMMMSLLLGKSTTFLYVRVLMFGGIRSRCPAAA